MFVPDKKPVLSPRLETIAMSSLSVLSENEEMLYSEDKFLSFMKEITQKILNPDEERQSPSDLNGNDQMNSEELRGKNERFRHIQAMRNKRQNCVEYLQNSRPPRPLNISSLNVSNEETAHSFTLKDDHFEKMERNPGTSPNDIYDNHQSTDMTENYMNEANPLKTEKKIFTKATSPSKLRHQKGDEQEDDGMQSLPPVEIAQVNPEENESDRGGGGGGLEQEISRSIVQREPMGVDMSMQSLDFSGGKGGLWTLDETMSSFDKS